MKKFKQKKLLLLTFGLFIPLNITTLKVTASTFGAEIFCTMREGGNDHNSSWEAAYTYIKQQKGGIFKVSPKRAASQITETVIRENKKFSYCVEFLDKLHPNRNIEREYQKEEERMGKELEETNEEFTEEFNEEFNEETLDRYSY